MEFEKSNGKGKAQYLIHWVRLNPFADKTNPHLIISNFETFMGKEVSWVGAGGTVGKRVKWVSGRTRRQRRRTGDVFQQMDFSPGLFAGVGPMQVFLRQLLLLLELSEGTGVAGTVRSGKENYERKRNSRVKFWYLYATVISAELQ